jgi:inorganic pyrophosphatase
MEQSEYYTRGLPSPRENFRHLTEIDPPAVSAEEEALAQLILSPEANEAFEGLREFIDQKREIFLVQLAIDTKREELQRLERLEREEDENLTTREGEIMLFREQFRQFLEADSKALVDARQAAETKAKQRLEISLQIKQISAQISHLRNDIAHSEEKLQECEGYRAFIEGLTPPEWRVRHPLPEMYFQKPEQLLEVMEALESQNMFLIRHCQDAEEAVERYKDRFAAVLTERDATISSMTGQRTANQRHLDDTAAFNEHYKIVGAFCYGSEIAESELTELTAAVAAFHEQLGFRELTASDPVAMLKRIEERMEVLFVELAKINQDIIKEQFASKIRQRRDMERAEKAAKAQREQEEKTQRALQLSQMPIKRKVGRPVYPRTLPMKTQSREKREEQMRIQAAQREANQNLLYGPIWE